MAFDPVTGPPALLAVGANLGNLQQWVGNISLLLAQQAKSVADQLLILDACTYLESIEGASPNAQLIADCRALAPKLGSLVDKIGNFPQLWSVGDQASMTQLAWATAGVSWMQGWQTALVTAGGAVSTARRGLLDRLWGRLVLAGIDTRLEFLQLYNAESATQALFDLKRKVLSTAVNSPTFAANQGYTGITSAYVNTGFDLANVAAGLTDQDCCHGLWVRSGPAGTVNDSVQGAIVNSSRAISIKPKGPNQTFRGRAMCAEVQISFNQYADYSAMSRRPGNIFEMWKAGLLAATVAGTTGTGLPTGMPWLVLAANQGGVPQPSTLYQVAMSYLSRSLSAAQHFEFREAVREHIQAVG